MDGVVLYSIQVLKWVLVSSRRNLRRFGVLFRLFVVVEYVGGITWKVNVDRFRIDHVDYGVRWKWRWWMLGWLGPLRRIR